LSKLREKRIEIIATILVLFIAIYLRWFIIDREGYWLDEVMQIRSSLHNNIRDVWKNVPKTKPPLSYFELFALTKISISEKVLRFPSFLASVFALVISMKISYIVYNKCKYSYVLTGLYIALSPLDIQLSREVLPYAQSNLFIVIFCFSVIVWIMQKDFLLLIISFLSASISLWFAYQSLSVLLSFITLFVVCALLYFAQTRIKSIQIINHKLSQNIKSSFYYIPLIFLSIISTFPLYRNIHANFSNRPAWGAPPFSPQILKYFFQMLSAGYDGSKPNYIFILFGLAGALSLFINLKREQIRLQYIIIATWLILGLSWIYIFAGIQNHWIASRYLIYFIPPFAILVSGGFRAIINLFSSRQNKLLCFFVILSFMLFGIMPTYKDSLSSRPNFRGLAKNLSNVSKEGDLVLFHHSYEEYCYSFYQQNIFKGAPKSTYFQKSTPNDLNPNLIDLLKGAKRVWIPERVYEAYRIAPEVKMFFIDKMNTNQNNEDIKYRLESKERILNTLYSNSSNNVNCNGWGRLE